MSLVFYVRVVPKSSRAYCMLDKDKDLKCYVKSPPEKGKANAELIAFLSKALGIAKNEVSIISGATSRRKRIKIERDIDYRTLLGKLGIQRQLEIPGAK